jgi:hypothetical protein
MFILAIRFCLIQGFINQSCYFKVVIPQKFNRKVAAGDGLSFSAVEFPSHRQP